MQIPSEPTKLAVSLPPTLSKPISASIVCVAIAVNCQTRPRSFSVRSRFVTSLINLEVQQRRRRWRFVLGRSSKTASEAAALVVDLRIVNSSAINHCRAGRSARDPAGSLRRHSSDFTREWKNFLTEFASEEKLSTQPSVISRITATSVDTVDGKQLQFWSDKVQRVLRAVLRELSSAKSTENSESEWSSLLDGGLNYKWMQIHIDPLLWFRRWNKQQQPSGGKTWPTSLAEYIINDWLITINVLIHELLQPELESFCEEEEEVELNLLRLSFFDVVFV